MKKYVTKTTSGGNVKGFSDDSGFNQITKFHKLLQCTFKEQRAGCSYLFLTKLVIKMYDVKLKNVRFSLEIRNTVEPGLWKVSPSQQKVFVIVARLGTTH